ncbi:hypothetical protein ILFOPFJJ_05588 [Ensifer psoraleae]|nr:hypothetical protein [Sinorhizobium psoraleae]
MKHHPEGNPHIFSHIILGTRGLNTLARFYDAVLAPIGL